MKLKKELIIRVYGDNIKEIEKNYEKNNNMNEKNIGIMNDTITKIIY